jgi:hypothetical protein
METRISISINEEALAKIDKAIETITQNLPELINLSSDERHTLPKIGDKSVTFVNKNLDYAKQNPMIVPGYLSLKEFEMDAVAVATIRKVMSPLEQLLEKLDDTNLLAGSEAYTAALIFYNAVKCGAKAGVPGMKKIFEDLQTCFPGRGKL